MRFRYYMVVQDLSGNVVDSASVSVYLAGTTTPATVYPTRTSTSGSNVAPQASSAQDGSVVFWLDSNDYSYGQLFDIVVQKGTFSFQLSDVQIIVWDAVNAVKLDGQDGAYYLNRANHTGTQPPSTISPQGSGSGLNADKLDGQEGSYYLNRANHTGTQPPNTISPQGSGSGLSADNVDGFDASLTPGPNIIVPLNASGILDLSATYVKSNVYTFRRVDLTNATSDYMLQVGEEAIVNFTNATSVALHIATQSGTYYEMDVVVSNNVGTSGGVGAPVYLNPNNTTYSNAFSYVTVYRNTGSSGSSSAAYSAFRLSWAAGDIRVYLINFTTHKSVKGLDMITGLSEAPVITLYACQWNDTTTAWTSLGTITFPQSTSGYILVRRLA